MKRFSLMIRLIVLAIKSSNDRKYFLDVLVGMIRARYHSKIIKRDPNALFVIGCRTDLEIHKNARIIIRKEPNDDRINTWVDIDEKLTSIGIYPPAMYLRPATRGTRICLREGATLILHEGVQIFPGSFINVGKDAVLEIGKRTACSYGMYLNTKAGLKIGSHCLIADEVRIMDYDGHPVYSAKNSVDKECEKLTMYGQIKRITIEDHVWIGARATINKGVILKTNSIIGASSVVTKDVPESSVVGGNPAKVIAEGIVWERQ